jgi:hypothetical protein
MPRRRPEAWRTGYAIRSSGGGVATATVFGNEYFYSSTASRTGNGKNPDEPSTDFESLMGLVESHDAIYVAGDIRFQGTAPLGSYGVKIIGAVGGRNRHVTSDGVVLTGNGVAWREEATAGDAALIELREQGWEIHNILMLPQSGYAAVKLHCEENATYPDASHFIASNVRFISTGTRVGYGIEDVGGAAHIGVYDCEFRLLEYAWKQTSVGIRNPQDHEWFRNRFSGCKTDIGMNAARCSFRGNRFETKYDGTNHPTTLNLALTADSSEPNFVIDNEFTDAAADVTIAKGYKPATGDVWRNRVAGTAADIVTVPS